MSWAAGHAGKAPDDPLLFRFRFRSPRGGTARPSSSCHPGRHPRATTSARRRPPVELGPGVSETAPKLDLAGRKVSSVGVTRRRRGLPDLLLILLVIARGMSPALALCIGTGGHQAIEPLGAACCRSVVESPMTTERRSIAPCSSHCTDTPLSMPSALRSPDGGDRRFDDAVVLLTVPVHDPGRDVSAHPSFALDPATSFLPAPRALRTTINRC